MRKREREKKGCREMEREREGERGRERERERCRIFLKGMMGALASFSYLVLRYQWFNNVASQQFKVRFGKTQPVRS